VVDGVSANAGPIALRGVTVAAPTDGSYPKGSDATLQLVIVNDSTSADKLVGVTSPVATEVRLFASAADASLAAESGSAATPSSSGSSVPSSPVPGSSAPASSAPGSSVPGSSVPGETTPGGTAPATVESINLPGGRAQSIGYTPDLPVIQLHALTQQLFPAQTLPITFQFANAGSVTFTIAVHLAAGPATRPSIDVAPTAEN
jgi:copper(I)-binding protein